MKTLTCVVLSVAAIAAIVLSSSAPKARAVESVRKWFFAEMLAISETYNSTRPDQMRRDAEYEASCQRIIAADKAAHE